MKSKLVSVRIEYGIICNCLITTVGKSYPLPIRCHEQGQERRKHDRYVVRKGVLRRAY